MQETRLNILLNSGINQLNEFFSNPWRKLVLIFLSLFFGFFITSAVSTTLGQAARWDITAAAVFLIFSETVNIIVYRRSNKKERSLWLDLLNSFKIGFVYGLYLEALKLGS